MKVKLCIFSILLTFSLATQAQTGNIGYYNEANHLFGQKKFYEAAQVYEKYLASEKNGRGRGTPFAIEKKKTKQTNQNPHQESVFHLAECYRQFNDYTQAEKWYKIAIGFSASAYPTCQYWYGVTLRANQKYKEAFEIGRAHV